MTHPPRAVGRLAAFLMLVVIGIATLRPVPPAPTPLPIFCLACGELGTLDVVLNVVLFIPFGIALVVSGVPWPRAVLVGAGVSLGIESLQFSFIAGRDTSLSDLMANTAGTLAGALLARHWRAALLPGRRMATGLAAAATLGVVGVMAATVHLLRPTIPPMGLWGQWTPRQPAFEPYAGRVDTFRIGGIDVPYNLVPESEALRQLLLTGHWTGHVAVVSGDATSRLSGIARLGSRFQEVVLFGAHGTDFVFRTRLTARNWQLRNPSVRLPGALLTDEAPMVLRAGMSPLGWHLEVQTDAGGQAARIPFSPALGWTFLLPFDYPMGPRDWWISALWMAALTFVPSYFGGVAAGRGGGSAGARRGRRWAWGVAPALGIGAGFALTAAGGGFLIPPPGEWLGVAAGSLSGALAAHHLLRKAGPVTSPAPVSNTGP